ncbi:MAG: hypothetical protein LBQ57_05065 [Spirochaetales bacterium]|nr:hypothetical protein [Spirochaetales bacterium]
MCDTFFSMTLFLIAGMPVFFIALLNMFFSGSFYGREILAPLGIGGLWFFPFCLIYALFSDLVPVVYGGGQFYLSRTFIDLAVPLVFCLLTCLVTCRSQRADGKELFLRVAAFLTGFFTLFAQYVCIIFPEWYAEYIFFLLPLLWMSLSAFSGLLVSLFFSGFRIFRFLFLILLGVLPFCMGAVPWLYAMNYRPLAWLVTLLFFAGSLVAVWKVPLR